jgi:hypothetical protein
MTVEKFYSPLKIGLFIVVLSYFLWNLHITFTLSWIGEWNFRGHVNFNIEIQDLSGFVGDLFRFAASILAFGAMIYYFAKKNLSKPTLYKILRWILVLEAIYWLGLMATTVTDMQSMLSILNHTRLDLWLRSFALGELPSIVESIVPPIVLLVLAFKLSPDKPLKGAIKWALITGTVYIFVFWLLNSTLWIDTWLAKGTTYLTTYPQNLFSFITTIFGLLALGIYAAYFTKKSLGAQTLRELNLKKAGAIITALGLFFLWNYLTWIFFGGWSSWYAWFMGHDADLWMLSLPLLGVPMLFADNLEKNDQPK